MTAMIHTCENGKVLINYVDDNCKSQQVEYVANYDMSRITPVENDPELIKRERRTMFLNRNQLYKLVSAMKTEEGRRILNNLKNSKSNEIINIYLEDFKKELPEKKGFNKFKSFIESIIKQPLLGQNLVREVTIGLTQSEIYAALVDAGLIQL